MGLGAVSGRSAAGQPGPSGVRVVVRPDQPPRHVIKEKMNLFSVPYVIILTAQHSLLPPHPDLASAAVHNHRLSLFLAYSSSPTATRLSVAP
jgi:hypothetical protein